MTPGSGDPLESLSATVHPSWRRAARRGERAEVARWLGDRVDEVSIGAGDPRAVRSVRRRLASSWLTGRAFLVGRLGAERADALDARALRPIVRALARLQLAGVLVAASDAVDSTSTRGSLAALAAAREALAEGARPTPDEARRALAAAMRAGLLPADPALEPLPVARLAFAFGLYGLACAAPDGRVARGLARRSSRAAGRRLEAFDAGLEAGDRTSAWAERLREVAFPRASRSGAA